MQSGAQSTAPIGPTDSSWQEPYDLVLTLLGCDGTAPLSSSNSTESSESTNSTTGANANGNSTTLSGFECLKQAPADALVQAQEAAINASAGA